MSDTSRPTRRGGHGWHDLGSGWRRAQQPRRLARDKARRRSDVPFLRSAATHSQRTNRGEQSNIFVIVRQFIIIIIVRQFSIVIVVGRVSITIVRTNPIWIRE